MVSTAARCRTLIVEDDPASRSAMEAILHARGYPTETASTVTQAVEKLRWKPECIILDLMLPDGNGLLLLQNIRDQQLPIRVGIATAAADVLLQNAIQLHPDAIFRKPLDFAQVLRWLEEE